VFIVHFGSGSDTLDTHRRGVEKERLPLGTQGLTEETFRTFVVFLCAVMVSMATDFTIREAARSEVAIVLHHRWAMFRDMGQGTAEELDRMVKAAEPLLALALDDGSYRHWLAVEASGRVVGGGGVLLCPWPANPKDACTERAMILNVYTEPEFRKLGVARRIMQTILHWIRTRGLLSANLHASDEGRVLYEKLGFVATNEMRLRFDGEK
jgi:GNAT superfamily N-acetyltransferase